MTIYAKLVSSFRGFIRCRRASISIITAVLIPVLIGIAGIGIDVASIVYWRVRLQDAADAAALAAVFDLSRASEIAETSLGINGPPGATVDDIEVGRYDDNPDIDKSARFVPGAADNAAQVSVGYDSEVHFLKLFTGSPVVHLTASATAYNLPLAGVEIGTGAVDADMGLLNGLLQGLAGTPLALTQAEVDALESSPISAFRLFEQLAIRLGSPDMSVEDIVAANIGLANLADAAADALAAQTDSPTSDQLTARGALERIAGGSYGATTVPIENILAFQAHSKRSAADMVSRGSDSLGVSGMNLLMGYFHGMPQNSLLNLGPTVSVPGLASISTQIVFGTPDILGGSASAAAVGPVGTNVYSSQGRVVLNISLLNAIQINLGIINLSLGVNVPLIIDLGYGGVNVQNITCGPDIENTTDIELSAQSGLAQIYVGSETLTDLLNFATPLTPSAATIVNVPLVNLSASGTATIGQSSATTMHFDRDDIADGTTQTVNGTSTISASLTELSQTLAITVNNAPLGSGGLISGLVRAQLTPVFAALGPVVDTLLASYGLRVGYMDVKATAVRCGIPALVT